MNLEENWPNNSNIYLSEPDQYHPFFRRDNILNNEKKNLKETKNLKAIRRKTNEKALTLSPKKFPLTRTFSKSSINKSSAKEKISRQNTFVLRKPKNIFLDEGDMSSDRSSKEEKIFDIDFIKKKPEELEIYDSLMEKVPKSQMKIIADNRFSTVIDSKSFCLTLQKDEAQQTIKPSKDSNKFNSGSIADNVLRHFVGKEKEFDQKSGLLKQMSMKFPARNSEIPKSRNSFLGFLKINNKVHDSASTDKNTMTTNKKLDIPLSKSSTPQKSEEESEIEISPTLKNEIEPPSSKSSPKSKTDYKAVQKKKDLEQLSEEVNFTPELTFDETKQNPKKSFNLQLSQKDETKDSKVISNDFTLEDFLTLKNEIEREKKILEEEIQNVTMSKYTNIEMKLKGKFVQKWARAKWNIKAASRMRRLNEDIKCYGSSFNVTGIAHKLGQLEGILMKQKTLTIKNNKTYIFLPSSRFKIYWSYIVILLLIYTAYITPYRIAFADTSLEYDDWFFIETIIDILFLIDILITLNCAYFDSKGHIITSRLNIFLTYLKTWLILDILGIFPFYLIDQFTSDSNSSNSVSFGDNYNDLFKFLRLPRLYRLIRIARLVKFIKKAKTLRFIEYIQDFFHLNNGSIKLIKFLFTISVIVHIVGCMWFFLAKIQNFAPDTWVAQLGMQNQDNVSMYITTIYWAFATLATVGYGDVHPFNDVEYLFTMVWMIFGAGFYSFTLGSLSTLLANLDTRRAHLTHKLMLMDEFCKENKFSKSLKHRVKKALEYISIKTIFSSDDKNQILNEIPTDLRFQIAEMMFNGIFNKIAFFKNKDKCFIANFVPLLNPLKVLQGELIYRKSEYPNLIYFLSNGRVNYVVGPQNIVFKSMVQGSYFGEMEVFDNKARYFTCRAEVDCDLLTIPSDKFASIMESFPDHLTEIKSIIRQRRKQNEIALEKIKSIAPISINSEFWKKKKDVNIYEAVKRKRLRSETSNFNQNIKEATATKDTGNKLKRFFTSIFAKGRASLFKQSSQSQDSDFNNIASPVRGLEVIQKSIPIIKLTKNSSNKDIEINNYSNYNPNAGNNLNTENANLIKEPYKTEFSSNDLLPLNSNHLLMTNRNNSEENNVIQIQSLKETENSQEKTTRNKKKKVTIQFSKEDEEVKPRKSFENSFIYSEGHLKQNLVNNNETNDFINKTEIERGRSKTQTNLQETRNLSMNPLKDKMNIKLTEIKEIEEGDRKRSSSEFKKANLEPRRSSIRKFSTFKNREITNILESFLKSPKLIEKRRKNNRKEKVKKKIIFENELLVLKESVMKQTLNIESNERNIDNIQIQLNQANEYLKMACKRNKIIKKDINFKGFFNRKDTFIVGEKTFVNSDIQKPDLGSQKGNIVLMSEKLHLQEIKDFPEPDNFVLYKNL